MDQIGLQQRYIEEIRSKLKTREAQLSLIRQSLEDGLDEPPSGNSQDFEALKASYAALKQKQIECQKSLEERIASWDKLEREANEFLQEMRAIPPERTLTELKARVSNMEKSIKNQALLIVASSNNWLHKVPDFLKELFELVVKEKLLDQIQELHDTEESLNRQIRELDEAAETLQEQSEADKKSLQAVIDSLRENVGTKNDKIAALEEEVKTRATYSASRDAAIVHLEASIQVRDDMIKRKDGQVEKLKTSVNEKDEAIQQKDQVIDSLEKQVRSGQIATTANKKTMNFLRRRITLSKRMNKLKGKTIASLRKTIESRKRIITARNEKNDLLRAELGRCQTSNLDAHQRISGLEAQYKAKEDEAATLTVNMANQATLWKEKEAALQTSVANRDKTIETLQSDNATAAASIVELRDKNGQTIRSLTADVESSKDRVKTLESEQAQALDTLNAKLKAIQESCGKAEQEVSAKQKDMDELNKQLQRSKEACSKAEQDLLTRLQEIEEIKADLSDAKRDLDGSRESNDKAGQELVSLRQDIAKKSTEMDSVNKKVTELEENARKLAETNSDRIHQLEQQGTTLTMRQQGLAVFYASEFKSAVDPASWMPFVDVLLGSSHVAGQPLSSEQPWSILPPWTLDHSVGEKALPGSILFLCGQLFSGILNSEFNDCQIL